ncbi:inositol-pentakisphosphate 2-kinase isoform X1 [Astyanax mexicanus]|uniref:inositol-pentakisphosphate 2-kinase isoform X1 n=1 Tax=Astyanax mexicanus TaxID=7994 RepID=UPI000BBDC8D0|nr:inositol-pentakisphosphate 2-kinase isoform X1 [Astyanax mexicanus]
MALDKMDENDWKYHGEGNKSLVVSHVQHSRVLRLLKYPSEDAENTQRTTEQAFQHILNIVEYNRNVMKPLLGEKYVHSGEVVKLPLDFVRQLSLKVQQERPELRCDKVMDTFSGCGLCLPNLTHLSPCHFGDHRPPLCVEIKPKCGFLPFSRHVTKECKRKVCRFCMHQHFKLANGKWNRLSRYCPLDLFSGSKQRMFVAIKHLLEEPQNNLKIFKGGELIYSCKDDAKQQPDLNELVQHLWPYFHHSNGLYNGHQSSKAVFNEFIQVICGALLGSGDSSRSGEPRKVQLAESRSVCEASPLHRELLRSGNHGLPKDSVLAKILQVQMLDNLDIEGVYPLYKRVEQYLEEFPKERNRLQVDGPYDEGFLEKVKTCPSEDDGSIEYAVGKVLQYRVAMTAKDCSIMITFAPCGEDEKLQANLEIQPPKPRFTYSVSILDLDPKPYDSIPHQYKLDSKIVNYYLRSTTSAQDLPTSNHYKDRQDCTLLFHPV